MYTILSMSLRDVINTSGSNQNLIPARIWASLEYKYPN